MKFFEPNQELDSPSSSARVIGSRHASSARTITFVAGSTNRDQLRSSVISDSRLRKVKS